MNKEFVTWATVLAGNPEAGFTWMLIPESPTTLARPVELHGTFDKVSKTLQDGQDAGCGVFACVNETDGTGRRKENITRIRALFCDIDSGVWVEPPIPATMVVRTRNGWHLYWVLKEPCLLYKAEELNTRIVTMLGGDMRAKDIARVLRVPGFEHLKGDPFMVGIQVSNGPKYGLAEIEVAFPPIEQKRATVGTVNVAAQDTNYGLAACAAEFNELAETGEGGRNHALCRAAFKLGALVAGGELTQETAIDHLVEATKRNGYWEDEGAGHVNYVIKSSLEAGAKKPRNPSEIPNSLRDSRIANEPAIPIEGTRVCDRWEGIKSELRRRLEVGFEPFPSPITGLNSVLGGGCVPGGITLICAAPGAGKSSLCLQWAHGVAKTGRVVIYVSLELNMVDLVTRVCLTDKQLSWIEARCGSGVDKMQKIIERQFAELPIHLYDRKDCSTAAGVRQVVNEVVKTTGRPPLVIIDYLQMLTIGKNDDEIRGAISTVSNDLRTMAQDTGAAVLLVSAVSRAAYNVIDKRTSRPDRNAVLASAKESGGLEYDCEALLGIYIFHGTNLGWLSVAKNRSGGPCADIPVRFDGATGVFSDADEEEVYLAWKAINSRQDVD